MNSAEVVDILRGSQRDNLFVNDIQDDLQSLYKVLGPRNYQLRQTAPIVANAWYYLITSLGNVQTLGEEYTGTIRLTKQNTIPTKLVCSILILLNRCNIFIIFKVHSMWLLLYVGGEPLLERLILKLKSDITNSTSLTHQAQAVFLGILNFLSSNKSNLKRIHQALFYINGRYYNVSNRITGIRYVCF